MLVNFICTKGQRESETPVDLTDYEDNKMKKDSLATLHCYNNKQLLSNLHLIISILLNNEKLQGFFEFF